MAAVAYRARAQRAAMQPAGEPGRLWPQHVVEAVAQVYRGAQVTVDAGAHMFPVMALWDADGANRVLISNGLATMGFALPAAIGAALLDPAAPVVAFTGDGGLLMCLGELGTAARVRARIRIVVFDDQALSLIQIKQAARAYQTASTDTGPVDWVALAEAMGVRAVRAGSAAELERGLAYTRDHPGPVLIAARVDPEPYQAMIRALRG
jgi:acetolactate synthase-1/2/3 large subunit